MTKPQSTTTKPQLLTPRSMRFADEEICATMLRITPVGQYDTWTAWQREQKPGAITPSDAVRIIAESAAWEAPQLRGLEWAQRAAAEAKGREA
jgi:hypothetical protein